MVGGLCIRPSFPRSCRWRLLSALAVIILRMSSVCTDLGGDGVPVMLMSAPMVVYGQTCDDVGSGEKQMSNGRAVGSERRWRRGSMVSGVFGCM